MLSKSTDFSRAAGRYDETRNLPKSILNEAYCRLAETDTLTPKSRILDAGCGTGQLSLPLVEQGFSTIGIDLSTSMLRRYLAKCPHINAPHLVAGDVQGLPFTQDVFEVTVVSKLFEHIVDWQRAIDEILRVTSRHCILIREKGHFGNAVRLQATQIAIQLGYTKRFLGLENKDELVLYFQTKGCQVWTPPVADLRWEENITYGQVLQDFQDGLFAEYWYLSNADYQSMLTQLRIWIEAQPAGMNTRQSLFPYLSIQVFSKVPPRYPSST